MDSSSTQWSLTSELCQLAAADSLDAALEKLGLASPNSSASVNTVKDWHRGGAETFQLFFDVSENGKTKHVLIKACTPTSPGVSVEQVLRGWLSRRKVIADAGVQVPVLFCAGNGVIVEEVIPYPLTSRNFASDARQKLLFGLGHYAGVLALRGFNPVGPFGDLRSRGHDIVVVDFGADLGAPSGRASSNSNLLELAHIWLEQSGVSLQRADKQKLTEGYLLAAQAKTHLV